MRKIAPGLGLAALVLAVAFPAMAQETLPLRIEALNDRAYPQVDLVVSMPVEMAGQGIPADAFVVTEDGKFVDALVEPVPTEGLDVVLLIDTSGSMTGGATAAAEEAASAFVQRMPAEADIAILGFGERAEVLSPFTADREVTIAAISSLGAEGETALYDGLIAATELFATTGNSRRVEVKLSDGGDTVSSGTLEEAIVALLSADATFFAVELRTAENDHEALERLGTATDGRVVPAGDPEALAAIFDEIAAAIVSQYHISFEAAGHDQTELVVSITAGGQTANIVHAVQFPADPAPPEPAPAQEITPAVRPDAAAPELDPGRLSTVTVSVGWLGQTRNLMLGLATLFVGLSGLVWYLGRSGRRVKMAADDLVAVSKTRNKASMLSRVSESVAGVAERGLGKDRKGSLERSLDAAGASLRPGEFVMLVLAASFASFVVGNVFLTPLMGLALAAVAVAVSMLMLSHRATKRRKAFSGQLVTTLQLIAGSLRAGFGLMQAFDVVVEESPSPTDEEFHRVKAESHLGRDLDDALEAMAERVQSEDMELVIEGIQIHREIGGNLSEIIDGVAETIRQRQRLYRQVRALSAEGRFSAGILVALPFAMGILLSITNPDYIAELTGATGGQITLVAAGLLMLTGIVWLKRLIDIDY
jgi:tight adherence protein B